MIAKKLLGDRLRTLEEFLGISGRQIALRINADVSYYNRARNGNGLSKEFMDRIVREFGVTKSWLYLGEGMMFEDGRAAVPRPYQIPLWGAGAICGRQVIAGMDGISEPLEWIDAGDYKDATGALIVYNDSMAPKYLDRERVAYKTVKDRGLILYGEDYIIETSEYRVLKNIQKTTRPGYIMACSYNMETWETGIMKDRLIHEPFEISLEKIRGLYLVLGKI